MSLAILRHPVAAVLVTRLRDKHATTEENRANLHRLSLLLAGRATVNLPVSEITVETPMAMTVGHVLSGRVALVPVMRAGHGMLDAFLSFLPKALVWHMSMSRDHCPPFDPILTDSKVPRTIPREVHTCFVLDPMLATAGSACFAIEHLKDRGARRIVFVGVNGCTQGVKRLKTQHPDVNIIMAVVDPTLNDDAYIVPGLGDAGDQQYPTE